MAWVEEARFPGGGGRGSATDRGERARFVCARRERRWGRRGGRTGARGCGRGEENAGATGTAGVASARTASETAGAGRRIETRDGRTHNCGRLH
jgi:hypothetical protein